MTAPNALATDLSLAAAPTGTAWVGHLDRGAVAVPAPVAAVLACLAATDRGDGLLTTDAGLSDFRASRSDAASVAAGERTSPGH